MADETHIPFESITVWSDLHSHEVTIPADAISGDIYHDIAEATLNVTFIGVSTIAVVRKAFLNRGNPDCTRGNDEPKPTLPPGDDPRAGSPSVTPQIIEELQGKSGL